MKALLLSLLMIVSGAGAAAAADKTPAGYITDIVLTGADEAAKTVVVRDGVEIAGKLMMPLYAGDVVFIREPASAVGIETGAGKQVTLGADLRRYPVDGQIDTGDSAWGILGAISEVFAGEGGQAPENMVSKGGDLKMAAIVRGTNMIATGRKVLWLGWDGGTAPYAVSLAGGSGERVLARDVAGLSAEVALPEGAGQRFTLIVRDARQQAVKIKIKVVEAAPGASGQSMAKRLAAAARLTGEGKGEWSLEAAQQLNDLKNGAASALLDKVRTGWRYGS